MPIEIRELVIKATIENNEGGAAGGTSSAQAAEDPAALIQACVEQVIRILEQKTER